MSYIREMAVWEIPLAYCPETLTSLSTIIQRLSTKNPLLNIEAQLTDLCIEAFNGEQLGIHEEARREKSPNNHRCSPPAWPREGRELLVAGSSMGLEEQRVKLGSPAGKQCKQWLSQQRGQGHSRGMVPQLSAVEQWCFRQRNGATELCHTLNSQNSCPVALGIWLRSTLSASQKLLQ